MTHSITLGVTGGISAYKAVLVLRELQRRGFDVRVVMTSNAREFVQPLTFQAISGHPVVTEMWGRDEDETIRHISLARETDALVVVPATANSLAKFAHGVADDFLSALYLSITAPVVLVPAMNVEMWRHPATRANCALLSERGNLILPPESGYLACGTVGEGRLPDPETIVDRVADLFRPRDFTDQVVLVTAGPTVEDLDPVRFLTNRSSGKMGYAIAEAARDRGARVILVSGPVDLPNLHGIETLSVRSTRQMYEAVLSRLPEATIVIKAAAVCDYRPARVSEGKMKKDGDTLALQLETTEDILAEVARRKQHRIVVGFAAETDDPIENGRLKLKRKGVDLLVVNDVSRPGVGFDGNTNEVTVLSTTGESVTIPLAAKRVVADRILDLIRSIDNRRVDGQLSNSPSFPSETTP